MIVLIPYDLIEVIGFDVVVSSMCNTLVENASPQCANRNFELEKKNQNVIHSMHDAATSVPIMLQIESNICS